MHCAAETVLSLQDNNSYCMSTFVATYWIHVYPAIDEHAYPRTLTHTHTHTHTQTHTHTDTHIRTHTTDTHSYQTPTHTETHSYRHTHSHTLHTILERSMLICTCAVLCESCVCVCVYDVARRLCVK